MMKTISLFLFIGQFFILTGIAYAGSFEQGMSYFEKRNYARARTLWQPLAKQGDARAQYNLALIWLKEDKQPLKAKEYLVMSRSQGLVDGYFLDIASSKSEGDSVSAKKIKVIQSSANKQSPASGHESLDWLNQQSSQNYTLQLATAKNRVHMEAMQKKLLANQQLKQLDNLYIHEVHTINKKGDKTGQSTRYVLIYGVFESYQEAKQEVAQLPDSLQKSSPWIRQFRVLQSIVNNKQ